MFVSIHVYSLCMSSFFSNILIILLMSDANTKKAHDATCLHCIQLKLAHKIILLSIYNEVLDCLLLFTLTLLTDNHHLARYSNRFLSHNLSKLVFFPGIQAKEKLILTNTFPLIKNLIK